MHLIKYLVDKRAPELNYFLKDLSVSVVSSYKYIFKYNIFKIFTTLSQPIEKFTPAKFIDVHSFSEKSLTDRVDHSFTLTLSLPPSLSLFLFVLLYLLLLTCKYKCKLISPLKFILLSSCLYKVQKSL